MHEDYEQFDALEKKVSGALGKDLKALFSPEGGVPGEVDRAVLDAARRRLVRPARRRRLRLVWGGAAAAVAAAVLLAVVLNVTWDHRGQSPSGPAALLPADVDRNGRVDILDAYKLARRAGAGEFEAAWDLNADGRVDRADVDLVALAAVRLDGGA